MPPDLMVWYSALSVFRIFSASLRCGDSGYFWMNGLSLVVMMVSYCLVLMRSGVGSMEESFLKASMEGSTFEISRTFDFKTVFSP